MESWGLRSKHLQRDEKEDLNMFLVVTLSVFVYHAVHLISLIDTYLTDSFAHEQVISVLKREVVLYFVQ